MRSPAALALRHMLPSRTVTESKAVICQSDLQEREKANAEQVVSMTQTEQEREQLAKPSLQNSHCSGGCSCRGLLSSHGICSPRPPFPIRLFHTTIVKNNIFKAPCAFLVPLMEMTSLFLTTSRTRDSQWC